MVGYATLHDPPVSSHTHRPQDRHSGQSVSSDYGPPHLRVCGRSGSKASSERSETVGSTWPIRPRGRVSGCGSHQGRAWRAMARVGRCPARADASLSGQFVPERPSMFARGRTGQPGWSLARRTVRPQTSRMPRPSGALVWRTIDETGSPARPAGPVADHGRMPCSCTGVKCGGQGTIPGPRMTATVQTL